MALKVSVADDHFVKVRQIIKDLIERLQSDASSEKTEKKYCDDNTAKAVETRDKEQAKIEDFRGQIAAKEAQESELKDDIAELSKEVAGLKKALLEATELRSEEKVENEKTVKEAGEGKAAVETALKVLQKYYKPSFIQRSAFVPKDSDREGNTVADAAPDIFDSEYGGNKDASKGIIGLLEVILSDFDRTETTVEGEETAAQKKYDGFKTSTDKDTGAKEGTVTSKKGKISTIKGDVVTLKDDLKKAEGVHESAVTELGVLHKRCVAGDETHEERVASRQKEIAALKEAHNLLEDWQS